MRICVIFNPAARGEKAKHFREHLRDYAADCAFKPTSAPGDAQRLAAEAARENFQTIVAAGGDGTVNEVLNGLASDPQALEHVRMGVLPLGTVNVFARELSIPPRLHAAWNIVRSGKETSIDLPKASFASSTGTVTRYFAQLAGAGLDARAVELVNWDLKKKVGPLAYVLAGLKALREKSAQITVSNGATQVQGQLVLIGNGRLYGGPYRIFPEAELEDGLLEVCVLPQVNWFVLARCGPQLLMTRKLPGAYTRQMRGGEITLSSPAPIPFELDGELAGVLPVKFTVERKRLRVVVP
jgi:YegS/Rv2252/BmrU family lipid kinase